MHKKDILTLVLLTLVPLGYARAQEQADIRPFQIKVAQSVLDDLDQRLASTLWLVLTFISCGFFSLVVQFLCVTMGSW